MSVSAVSAGSDIIIIIMVTLLAVLQSCQLAAEAEAERQLPALAKLSC
jgi:hypothetical protein